MQPKQNKLLKNKSKAKQSKAKLNKTKQNKTKQNKTKQNKTKQNKTKPFFLAHYCFICWVFIFDHIHYTQNSPNNDSVFFYVYFGDNQ